MRATILGEEEYEDGRAPRPLTSQPDESHVHSPDRHSVASVPSVNNDSKSQWLYVLLMWLI